MPSGIAWVEYTREGAVKLDKEKEQDRGEEEGN